MNMTREEAIKQLKSLYDYCQNILWKDDCDAIKLALSALRPVSREQVEKVWGGCGWCDEEWGTCDPITNRFTMPPRGGIRFCPMCGKPLTDEAVEMVMERLEALKDES